MYAMGLDIQGDAPFACKVGHFCMMVDDSVQCGPDVVLQHAPTLPEAARRICILVSHTGREGIPTFDAEIRPLPIDTPEHGIYQLAQDETDGSGGDGVVGPGDTPRPADHAKGSALGCER
jgi:hypothetical protein